MSTPQTQYELFLSYSRQDNAVPAGPAPGSVGWVTALRDHIVADHRRYSTEPLRIFFDTEAIKDMDDWRHRILTNLRVSKILLVCLSLNYFASEYCRWEWEEYCRRQVHQLMGSDSVATVYFVEVPGSDEQENAKWLDSLLRGNYTDIRPWFPAGAKALAEEAVQQRMKNLGASLWERLQRARRAEAAPGNLRRQNPYFVGRKQELQKLHEHLTAGAVGVVTAVHGLGGQGKTELAIAYAHGFADCYPAGLWALGAEGKKELLPLIGELASDRELGFTPTEAERKDAALMGRGVLAHLKQRAAAVKEKDPDKGAAALLLLDNVSDPALLGPAQLATLPQADWLRIVATTRLGPESLKPQKHALAMVPVDSLEEEDALALLREHQPPRNAKGEIESDPSRGVPRFASQQDDDDARRLVRELGGFTLAVEQVAVFLGLHPEIAPGAYLTGLMKKGLAGTDEVVQQTDPATGDKPVAAQMLHQQKQLGVILDATLPRLDPPALTALQFAALLPPDTVPWPWLRTLTAQRHPALDAPRGKDAPDPWLDIRRRLEGLRLITGGDQPQIARIHRLVAAHLRERPTDPAMTGDLDALLRRRADAVYDDASPPHAWELDALVAAIPLALDRAQVHLTQGRDLACAAVFASDKVANYRSLGPAKVILDCAHLFLQRLAGSDPSNAGWQRDLSVSHNFIGDVLAAQGDLAGAQKAYRASHMISERLASEDPSSAAWQHDLSVNHIKVGDVLRVQGDLAGALKAYRASHALSERLAAVDPSNTEWQRNLSTSHIKVGDVLKAQGDLAGALKAYCVSLTIRERLATAIPSNAQWQRGLSVSHIKIGDVLAAQGELAGALKAYCASLTIRERLAEADPSNAAWQHGLSVSHERIGNMLSAQGELAYALKAYRAALATRERQAAADLSNATWQRDLSVINNKIGDVLRSQGDLTGARSAYRASRAILTRLAAADPSNTAWQRDLSVSHERIGDVLKDKGDLAVALKAYRASLIVRKRLVAADPSNALWQRNLAVSHERIGDVLKTQGDLAGALKAYRKSLTIRARLAVADPSNAKWQRDQWVSHWKIADLLEQQEIADAMASWRRAYEVLAGMKQRGLFLSPEDEQVLVQLAEKVKRP